ncbi:hypothetical protein [Haloarcula regularis]|uniref:hypothetical protein n=1 Tax=Haloarcula regularis TaxID=3033392 RepID=UPI0023E83AF2|nr:hypothetical protein [Halomicroarcula sp. SYNS111]
MGTTWRSTYRLSGTAPETFRPARINRSIQTTMTTESVPASRGTATSGDTSYTCVPA